MLSAQSPATLAGYSPRLIRALVTQDNDDLRVTAARLQLDAQTVRRALHGGSLRIETQRIILDGAVRWLSTEQLRELGIEKRTVRGETVTIFEDPIPFTIHTPSYAEEQLDYLNETASAPKVKKPHSEWQDLANNLVEWAAKIELLAAERDHWRSLFEASQARLNKYEALALEWDDLKNLPPL